MVHVFFVINGFHVGSKHRMQKDETICATDMLSKPPYRPSQSIPIHQLLYLSVQWISLSCLTLSLCVFFLWSLTRARRQSESSRVLRGADITSSSLRRPRRSCREGEDQAWKRWRQHDLGHNARAKQR